VTTYLGRNAGNQVLQGHIKRGDGETVHAVVWLSDLRDSTRMADTMKVDDFLRVLNGYFECTAGAVMAHGGEVLMFIGDAGSDGVVDRISFSCSEHSISAKNRFCKV